MYLTEKPTNKFNTYQSKGQTLFSYAVRFESNGFII